MVSQIGSGAGGLEGSPNVDLRTPAARGRRHSIDGTPGGGETDKLRDLQETSWTHRGVRTGGNPLRGMDLLRGADPLRGPVRGAESSNPILRRSDAPDATVGGAGFNMEQFRDMIKQIISEKKEKDRASAPMRFQADPMLDARNQTRQVLAEEMARERQRQAQFGANIPTTSGGEVHGHGEGGTSKGPTMQAGTNFGHTASVGNSKFSFFNVAMPPKFNPAEHTWMLWRPQVVSYFEMIGLEGILDEKTGDDFSLQVNRYAIGTLQQSSPSQDAAWMSTLRLRYAYEAWDQLQKAYGSRAELDMQKKLFEFESAAQRENESVREWAIRLERQVTELNVMAKEAAKADVMGYNEHRDTAVYESTHKFRLLNVRIDDQSYESFIAALRCQIFNMDVKEVETALITYEQGRDVQRALNSAAGGVSATMYPMSAGMGGRKFSVMRAMVRGIIERRAQLPIRLKVWRA
jgi:hypothetical protein